MGILPPIYVTNGVRSCKFAEALPGVRQGFADLQKRFLTCGKVLQPCKSILQTCGKVLQPCKSILQACGKVLQPCKVTPPASDKVLQSCRSLLQMHGLLTLRDHESLPKIRTQRDHIRRKTPEMAQPFDQNFRVTRGRIQKITVEPNGRFRNRCGLRSGH